MAARAVSRVTRTALRAHQGEAHLREVVDAAIPANDGIRFPCRMQVLAVMNSVYQQVEVDALGRLRSLGGIRCVRPLGGIGVGRVMAQNAHLYVVAIVAVGAERNMALIT